MKPLMKPNAILLAAGAICAIGIAAPLASQGGKDAELDAACRATEVTMPDSCACTITAARKAGLDDRDLASLFKDDGHSQPVDQAKYGRFWQVKTQCLSEMMLANLGITPGNPLPGVPANMRLGMPLPGAAQGAPVAAAPPRYAEPLPASQPAAGGVPARAPSAGAPCEGGPFSDPYEVAVCGDTGVLETKLLYDRALEAYPALLDELKRRAQSTFAEVSRGLTDRADYDYIVAWGLASANGPLVNVAGSNGYTHRGRLGGSTSLLWDAERSRMIEWEDVFDPRLWNGRIQRDYCAALRERFRQMQAQTGEPFSQCPSLDALDVTLIKKPSGLRVLSVSAAPGVITGYATSALYDGIELPLDAALLAGVQAPYRAALGAPAQTAAVTPRFIDRLGTVILGPPHFAQAPECVNEYYLQPERIGNPRGIADIRALVERSPGLVMVTGAGMLGFDDWRSGVVLDGRFVDLEEGPWDERLERSSFTGGGMTIHYEARQSWAEVSYGGWGYGDLVVQAEGAVTRIPVLQQSWQCT